MLLRKRVGFYERERSMKVYGLEWRTRDSFPEESVCDLRIEDEGRQKGQGRVSPIEEQQIENSRCSSDIERC